MKILIVQEAGRHEKNANYREAQCLARAFARAGHSALCWGLGYKSFVDIPFNAAAQSCDAILLLEQYDECGWIPDMSNIGKPKIFWSIDGHCNFDSHVILAMENNFDAVLNSVLNCVAKMQKHAPRSRWMPNAFPADLIDSYNADIGAGRGFPVGYCGTIGSGERQRYLSHLVKSTDIKCDIMVIGDAMVAALRSYKISFNRNVGEDINYRTFESMGAGAMLLTNKTPGLEFLFDIGKDCVTYDDEKDCVEKIRYYSEHDNERLSIARAGYEKAHREHTCDNRAREIIKLFYEIQEAKK